MIALFYIFLGLFCNAKLWPSNSQEHKNCAMPQMRAECTFACIPHIKRALPSEPGLTSRSQVYSVPSRRVTLHSTLLVFLVAFWTAFSPFNSLVCTSFVSLFAVSSDLSSCISFTFSSSLSFLTSSAGWWWKNEVYTKVDWFSENDTLKGNPSKNGDCYEYCERFKKTSNVC